ncbi:phage tail tape measure protein [Mycobacterium sp. MYCO198283]|uniref:phage tail tape measure protein n=1 Tax=Mycobacterium sp. MYCO198283 TaxID=2883505 RepID=UPI001E4C16EB|nr:phage tail tape measure protein [Mycobacterium sp. MYCO198283]MCG5431242.1 phage tail tape measure protein [Mycobacterium sp. MYCO198283]
MALDSIGYYALPVIPSFEGMDRNVNTQMRKSFGGLGKQLGRDVGLNVGQGLKQSAGQVQSAARAHVDALDKVKDATGKLRAEEAKLQAARGNAGARAQAVGTAERRLRELRASGNATAKQLETAERQVATARERARNAAAQATSAEQRTEAQRRRETAAAREAKRAEDDLARARRTASSAGSAGSGIGNPFKTAERSLSSSGSGLSALAGGIGTKVGGAFMGAMAAVVSVAAVGALFKSALDVGIDFERQVNMFSGVTNSGAEGMGKMREAARALGTDVTLAGTSASDAAAAMVELAKGGMTAQQAMDAARGTLQLSTAGQIDAAEAAKIQSAAINMFQLNASDATRVADLLAASANASSADVSDLGIALQAGGSAASGFGVSIEDTLTALTMFSRMGINGSDAGTMLKTSLLAITDQGNPAQGAIRELGLALYDAQGNFVGVESMMKQVAEASKRMTAEQFQANTAILFGSDAMRASMVAAQGGAEAWDSAAAAVTRQGAAADMAAANMQGLPGVTEALSNAWEGFKLKLFDVIDGPLITIGNWFTNLMSGGGPDWLQEYGNKFREVFGELGDILRPAFEQIKQGFAGIGNFFRDAFGPEYVEQFGKIKGPLLDLGKQIVATYTEAAPVLKVVAGIIGGALLGALKLLGTAYPIMLKGFTGGLQVAQTFYAGIKAVWSGLTAAFNVGKAIFTTTFDVIKGAISVAWSVISPVIDALKAAFGFLADAARYAFDTVILPMWHNLQLAFQGAMVVLTPVWDAIKAGLSAIGDAATWLWQNAIVPAWEGIKSAFTTAWGVISPVFTWIKDAFQSTADFIGGVWNGVAGTIKTVFDSIINAIKGPLRWMGGILQKVPLKVGLMEVPGAQIAHDLGNTLAGLREGGVAGRRRDGRLYGPGTGTSDSILGVDSRGYPTALVSTGEGVVKTDAMKRGGSPLVKALNAGWVPPPGLLHAMLPGYRSGGVVSDDEIARMGGGTVNRSILEAVRERNPSARLNSAKTDHDDDGGFHPKGMAIDLDPSRENLEALWAIRDQLTQIIYDDPDKVWYNVNGERAEGAEARAIYGEATMAQHRTHIHAAAARELRLSRSDSGSLPGLDALDPGAGPEEIARHIAAEGMRRGYDPETIKAAIAAGLKESGLDPTVTNATGHESLFQTSSDKGVGHDPRDQIKWFYDTLDKLGGPGASSGDPYGLIADRVEIGGYSGATLRSEQGGRASQLYGSVAPGLSTVDPYGGSSSTGGDSKAVREAEQRLADKEQAIANAERVLSEREQKLRELPDDASESQRMAAERQRDEAQQKLDRANRERDDAASDLDVARSKAASDTSGSSSTGGGGDSEDSQLGELGSIGKTFLDEMFGFGDLFPNPADLGIVKLASALMGIKYTPQGKGFPWQTGYANGDGTPWSGSPVNPLQGLVDQAAGGQLPLGVIPGVSSVLPDLGSPADLAGQHAGSGAPPGPVDQSTNVTINNPQGTPQENEQRIRRTLLKTPRYGTYTQNPGVMGT